MKGWILYNESVFLAKAEDYEVNRFIEVGRKEGVEISVFKPEDFDLTVTREDRKSVLVNGEPRDLPDFILPRMGSGTTYFAFAVIRQLERLGVFSVNSATSIETVKDKLYTQQILAENNIPVPKTMLVKYPINEKLVEKTLGFPIVVKTLYGSQGSGVFLCENKTTFSDLMLLIEATNKSANIILQEYISSSRGQDLRVIVVGGKAVACIKRIAREGDFKTNYSLGGSVEPFEITPEIEWLATQTSNLLGLEVAGIDLLFSGDHFKICEANSSPGFQGLESCVDIDLPKEIYHYIRIRTGIFG